MTKLVKVETAPPQLTVEKARALLATCTDLGEVKRIKDMAMALATYGRAQKAARESIVDAEEIETRALRRAGEIMLEMEKAKVVGPARQRKSNGKSGQSTQVVGPSKREALAEAGFDGHAVTMAHKLAKIPERKLEAAIEKAKESGAAKPRAVAIAAGAHVANNTGNNEWYTPADYLDAAREVLGEIDLDPASSKLANRTVGAVRFYTEEQDGLKKPWAGRVWMNPPYAQPLIDQFCERLATEYESKNVTSAIALVNNGTETRWGQRLLSVAAAVCFPAGRIRFVDVEGNPGGAPLQGQMIVYFGSKPAAFRKAFEGKGAVLVR